MKCGVAENKSLVNFGQIMVYSLIWYNFTRHIDSPINEDITA